MISKIFVFSLGAVSLDTLLQMFVSQERVSKIFCFHAEYQSYLPFLQVEGGALKQNTFGKLPECLCFHVQVFLYPVPILCYGSEMYFHQVPFHIISKLNLEYVSSQRTGFGGGQPYKRHDYVEFPVLLNMDRWAPLKLCYLRIKYDRNLGTPTQVSL